MYNAGDVKLVKWPRGHPDDTANVRPSLNLPQPTSYPSSVSTAPAPRDVQVQCEARAATPPLPPPAAPADLVVVNLCDEPDVSQVASLLASHGVEHRTAQRYVNSAVKPSTSKSESPADFF